MAARAVARRQLVERIATLVRLADRAARDQEIETVFQIAASILEDPPTDEPDLLSGGLAIALGALLHKYSDRAGLKHTIELIRATFADLNAG